MGIKKLQSLKKAYSREELEGLDKAELIEIILTLQETMQIMIEHVEKLLQPKDSQNSSKPPSHDQSRKSRRYPRQEKSGKKTGGQKGHAGKSRDWDNNPDTIITLKATRCNGCGADISQEEGRTKESRQIIEIPIYPATTTQYEQQETSCSCCGEKNMVAFPKEVYARVSMGIRLQSITTFFYHAHYGSYERTKQYLQDIYHVDISEGTIANILNRAGERLKHIEETIEKQLKTSNYIGSDETGTYIEGKRGWNFIFQNNTTVLIKAGMSRSFQMIEDTIGTTFQGGWVSDRLAAQLKIASRVKQVCLAHLLRETRYFEQTNPEDVFIKQFKTILHETIAHFKQWWQDEKVQISAKVAQDRAQMITCLYERLEKALISGQESSSEEVKTYCKGIAKVKNYILTCLYTGIPFHNNDSERPLRHVKNTLKVKGGFRTLEGAQQYARFLTFYHTSKRRNLNPFDTLCFLFS